MRAQFEKIRKQFSSDERGAVAIMFGFAFIAILMAVGVAIDTARAYHVRSSVHAAIDAAALAAGKGLLDGRLTTQEIEDNARQYFDANLQLNNNEMKFGITAEPNIDIDRSTGRVSISAVVDVPMTFMKIAGFDTVQVPVSTESVFEQLDIELSLALDLTGSMNRNGRIGSLKEATNDLVDILMPEEGTPHLVRIALAPYSSGVNAGSFSEAVTNNTSGGVCTFEREGHDLVTDTIPVNGSYLLERTDAEIGRQNICPTDTAIVPLTNDRDVLKNAIDTFHGRGATAGHLGIQWAWYMISENWASIFTGPSAPTNYSDDGSLKAVVVMTDGEFNTVKGDFGQVTQSNNLAEDMCTEMRNSNVLVFTIAFELNDDTAEQMLQNCAGIQDRFFKAEDGDALRAAFANIAVQLNNLRLSH